MSSVFNAYVFSQKSFKPEFGNPLEEPWRWTRFDELIGKGVKCISETGNGNIFFGLKKGVIVYDGLLWKEQNSSNGFVDEAINFLVYSEDGKLYAGCEKGLYVYDGKVWNRIFPLRNQHVSHIQNISSLIKINGGGVAASFGRGNYKGILFFQNGIYEILASKKTIDSLSRLKSITMHRVPNNKCIDNVLHVEHVFQDSQNRYWVWESKGNPEGKVFYFKKNNDQIEYSKLFTAEDGLVKGREAKFKEDASGNIWMINSTFHVGMSMFNGQYWKYTTLKGENSFLSIEYAKDVLWVGGFGVLYAYKNGKWEIYKRPKTPIPTSKIFVFVDSQGYLWISGVLGEVIRIDYTGNRWHSIKSLNYHCEDLKGKMWFIAVDGRVVVKKADKWFSYGHDNGLPDTPLKIYCTKKGLLCATGSYKGQACISFFDGYVWIRHLFPELSWGIDYRAVFEDMDSNLWISGSVNNFIEKGQKGGVIKIQNPGEINQLITHYLPESGMGMSTSYGFAQYKDGSIWQAGSHLARYKHGEWKEYSKIESLNQHINVIGNTPEGELWIGSRRFGVFRFKDNNWSVYNVDNGLNDNMIISIFPVDSNDVWIATNSDFCRFDGSSWSNNLFHDDLTLSQEEGDLQIQKNGTLWINRSSRNWKRRAIHNNFLEKDDKEYFSTVAYKNNSKAPDTKVTVYFEEVSSSGNTYIEWEGVDAWYETPSSKLQYSYRLNHGEWSHFSNKTNQAFFNLKDGNYFFEVRARDIDFNVDSTPAQVYFVVSPPVWKQVWFILLISTFLIVIFIYQFNAHKHRGDLEKLNVDLTKQGEEIARKNIILEDQKEQILQQILNEKEQSQSKLRFFTNISHEFRTPLTVITGIIEGLSKEAFKEKPDYSNEQLSIIKQNANRLLRLINQLMDFRKIDNNLMKLRVSKIDIAGYIKDVCHSFSVLANKYNISLHYHCNFKNLYCWLDKDKLDKIILNLISNAIKSTPEEGAISVYLNKVKINNKNCLEFIVEDTGIGIPENELEKIFERFYQLEPKGLDSSMGSGIGLSIVSDFVKLHHGKIYVESSQNQEQQERRGYSTRFIVQLPIDKSFYKQDEITEEFINAPKAVNDSFVIEPIIEEDLNRLYKKERPGKRDTAHVLIVEDNSDLRQFIADSLNGHFKVIQARNGAEGYDLTLSVLPDIVISDIMMPEMSGSELCNKIKSDIRTSHIPVILLTALVKTEDKIEGFHIGADDYITKPFNFDILFARVVNILSNREKLRQKFINEEAMHPDEEKVMSKDVAFLKKIKSVLEENYNNSQFNVEELSHQIGISSRHLLHKLKTIVGISPVEYIKTFRLEKAACLLSGKKGSVSEIAYDTGFNDISYFGRCFSKKYGMSPTEYAKTFPGNS